MKKKFVGIVLSSILIMSACAKNVPDEIVVDDAVAVTEATTDEISSSVCNSAENSNDSKKIEEYLPVFSTDESINNDFIQAIKVLESTGYMPNGEYCYAGDENDYVKEKDISYADLIAVCDVTGDGQKELLIRIEGGHTADISQWIFSYDEEKKRFEKLFVDFSIEYFDGGIAKCNYSHGGMYEDNFWPFDLYIFDRQTDSFAYIASVNSTQLLHDYETGELDDELNEDFPYEEDKDKDGKIYSISNDEEIIVMDNAEYEEWIKKYIDESKRITPDWHEIPKTAVID
ncbi:MAG: hypothetical protein E7309_16305 [Butyrivibrio sp.]|nr:hypothetical protein [Butyrivibrio sp.]